MDARVDKLIEVVRKSVTSLFPELAGRYHLVARGRVADISPQGLRVQPLTREGNIDSTAPQVECDAVPATLKRGNVVRIGYYFGDPSESYVEVAATAALGTMRGAQVEIENYGLRDCLVAEYLSGHTREVTIHSPTEDDDKRSDIPEVTVATPARIDFEPPLRSGDRVVAVPIEEGERFIILAKME